MNVNIKFYKDSVLCRLKYVEEDNKIYGTQLKPRTPKECKTYITNLVEVKNEKEDIILSVNLLKKEQEEIISSVVLPYEGEKKRVRIKP